MARINNIEELLTTSTELGIITRMDYTSAIIATNDARINKANGVPRNCFLIAVAGNHDDDGNFTPDNEEAILLSVRGIAELETSRATNSLREELAIRRKEPTDERSKAQLQVIGFDCKVVGTFYKINNEMKFGSDLDRVLAYSSYKVFRPQGKSLGLIASFGSPEANPSNDGPLGKPISMRLGKVRYSETRPVIDDDAIVEIDLRDFLGKKTAILAMSRAGKALSEDTRIPVPISDKFPNGWALNKDLTIGDYVYDTNMNPVKIVSFTEWKEEPIYKVTFDDGQNVETSGNHLWSVVEKTRYINKNYPENLKKKNNKEEKVQYLRKIASRFESTTYMSLRDIVVLTGYSMDRIIVIAKKTGIERQLRVSFNKNGFERKNPLQLDNLYPVKELINAIADSYSLQGNSKKEYSPYSQILTTEEIKDDLINCKKESKWAVMLPTDKNQEQVELLIDPYLLGYWLGDGNSNNAYITVDHKNNLCDEENISDREYLLSQITNSGHSYKVNENDPTLVHIDDFYTLLNKENLIGNKHIPAIFKRGSHSQKLSLLQGLMDSDGYVNKNGSVEFYTTNEKLVQDVLELVRSMGYFAKVRSKTGKYLKKDGSYKECKTCYIITFRAHDIVFKLPRKSVCAQMYKSCLKEYNAINNIEICEPKQTRCLTVESSNSLHLVEDFIPTHNSNTIKVIAKNTIDLKKKTGKGYGQIIFDPQGEYANDNDQDDGSLAKYTTGHDSVTYRLKRKNSGVNEELLLINFLDEANLELVWNLMLSDLENSLSGGSNYTSGLRNIDFLKPSKELVPEGTNYNSAIMHYDRKRLALYAFMKLSKITGCVKNLSISIGESNVAEVIKKIDGLRQAPTKKGAVYVSSVDAAYELFQWLMTKSGATKDEVLEEEDKQGILDGLDAPDTVQTSVLSDSWEKDFLDGDMGEFAKQFEAYRSGKTGVVSAFNRIRSLHSSENDGDVRERIWEDLAKGRLVIIDLSIGSPVVSKTLSELIMTELMDKASERFTSGEEAIPFQVIVEEAHNLFGSDKKDDTGIDPWVRLSKEAAKYKIGLIYATQEVTSVDTRILSNTSNWLIGHLNSKKETRELSGYYAFSDWADHLISSESKGFVRMKTFSSPFITPVQVDKFIVEKK